MATERLNIQVTEKGTRTVSKRIKTVGKDAKKSGESVDFLKKALAGIGTALVLRKLLNTGRAFQNLERRIKAVSTGAVDTAKNLDLVRKVSDETGTSLEINARLFQRLSIATRTLGVSSERVAGIVTTLNQALVIGGAGAEEARAALTQLSQGLASNRLGGDELRSLLENATLLSEKLAESLGVSLGELKALGAAGKLTSKVLVGGLEDAAAEIDAVFKQLGPSFDQSVARLDNSIIDLGESLQPAIESLTTLLNLTAGLAKGLGNIATVGRQLRNQQGDVAQNQTQSEAGKFRTQTLRLGNLTGAFPGGEAALGIEGLNKAAQELQDRLQAAGLRSNDLKILADSLQEVGGSAFRSRGLFEKFLIPLEKTAAALVKSGDATQDFVSSSRDVEEAVRAEASAVKQLEIEKRKAAQALETQLSALQNEALLTGRLSADKEALTQRFRAEISLRKVLGDVTSVAVKNQLDEIEVQARNIALQEQARDILESIRTPEEERQIRLAEIVRLQQAGALTLDQYNEALDRYVNLLNTGVTAGQAFVKQLQRIDTTAQGLSESFGTAVVNSIGQASDALADFIVEGANDIDALRDAIADILKNLAKQILSTIIEALILRAIVGESGGQGGQLGGLLGLFSGNQAGGPVGSGEPTIVGEQGRELFVPTSQGNIVPNSQMSQEAAPVNLQVVVVSDPSEVLEALESDEAKQIIISTARENKAAISR